MNLIKTLLKRELEIQLERGVRLVEEKKVNIFFNWTHKKKKA